MPISPAQLALITEAHALGLTDSATARHAGVSLSSVKRYRKRLGLSSACVTQMRGQEGEQLVAVRAAARSLHVAWRHRHDEGYDLLIEGQRIDAKTTLRRRDGSWRFYLPRVRRSFHGQYTYTKNYAADCDVLALVALYSDGRDPDLRPLLRRQRSRPAEHPDSSGRHLRSVQERLDGPQGCRS